MKKGIVIVLTTVGLVIGFVVGFFVANNKSKDDKIIIENARNECIEFNKLHAEILKEATLKYLIAEDVNEMNTFRGIAGALQTIIPDIMKIEEALKIDCTLYDESGEVQKLKLENRPEKIMRGLPTELRIIED